MDAVVVEKEEKKDETEEQGRQTSEDAYSSSSDDDDDLFADQLQHTSWRMPPDESLSDWTIEVVNKDDKSSASDVYHVHATYLAVGYKRSEYFARLFADDGRFAESKTKTSRIELDSVQAKVFPNLLDFLYSPTGDLDATTENIMELYALGQYFEMTGLRRVIRRFWENDMTVKTWPTYYKYSHELQCEKLEKYVMGFWANKIDQFDMSLIPLTDYNFWTRVTCFASCCNYHQKQLSIAVAKFCRQKASTLGKDKFLDLTRQSALPEVHVDAVIDFLEVENQLLDAEEVKEGTDLQTRCLRAIRNDWREIEIGNGNFLLEELGKCNPSVLSKVLMTLLTASKKTVKDMEMILGRGICTYDSSPSSSDSESSSEGDY